jgi:uncharacterized membrane protein YoaK (UPF0700 family)
MKNQSGIPSDQQQNTKSRTVIKASLGFVFGAIIGLTLGNMLGSPALGLIFGAGTGLIFGSAMDNWSKRKSNRADE